jgi:antitoxin MazE
VNSAPALCRGAVGIANRLTVPRAGGAPGGGEVGDRSRNSSDDRRIAEECREISGKGLEEERSERPLEALSNRSTTGSRRSPPSAGATVNGDSGPANGERIECQQAFCTSGWIEPKPRYTLGVYVRTEVPMPNALTKTLIKHGNSLALVIDKPILEMLRIEADTPLELTTNGDGLLISPIRDEKRQARLRQSLKKINAKFGDDLRRLAK